MDVIVSPCEAISESGYLVVQDRSMLDDSIEASENSEKTNKNTLDIVIFSLSVVVCCASVVLRCVSVVV